MTDQCLRLPRITCDQRVDLNDGRDGPVSQSRLYPDFPVLSFKVDVSSSEGIDRNRDGMAGAQRLEPLCFGRCPSASGRNGTMAPW
jgi:hypothetical protein